MKVKSITPIEIFRLQQESGAISIIDVREVEEYSKIRSTLAVNIPLSSFDPQAIAVKHSKKSAIYILCHSGKRSLRAAEILLSFGFSSVYNVEGGMIEWEASGLPIARN